MYNNGVHRNKRADDDKEDDCFPNPVDDNPGRYDEEALEPEVLVQEVAGPEDVSAEAADAKVVAADEAVVVAGATVVVKIFGAGVKDDAVAETDEAVAAGVVGAVVMDALVAVVPEP
jgi:hypothetical protein